MMKMLQQAIKNVLKANEKRKIESISKETESLSIEMEDIKKSPMEILESRNTMTKIKGSVMGSTAEWRELKKEYL